MTYRIGGGPPEVVKRDNAYAWKQGVRFYRLFGRQRFRIYVAVPPTEDNAHDEEVK